MRPLVWPLVRPCLVLFLVVVKLWPRFGPRLGVGARLWASTDRLFTVRPGLGKDRFAVFFVASYFRADYFRVSYLLGAYLLGANMVEFYLAGVCAVALSIVGVYLAAVYVAGDGLKEDVGAGVASRGGPRYANGFSLFELLIMVTFSGLLLQQAMVWKTHENDRAAVARTVRDIEQLRTALLGYYAAYNSYPDQLDPTVAIPSGPAFAGGDYLPVWHNVNAAGIPYANSSDIVGNPNPGGYGVVGRPDGCQPLSTITPCSNVQIITRLADRGQAIGVVNQFNNADFDADPNPPRNDDALYIITVTLGRPLPTATPDTSQ